MEELVTATLTVITQNIKEFIILIIGGVLGWQASVRLEEHRERYEECIEHRNSIREKVLKPMLDALRGYSTTVHPLVTMSGVTYWSTFSLQVVPPTNHPLYGTADQHFPNVFAMWHDYESNLKAFGEQIALLRSAVREYLGRETSLPLDEGSAPPSRFTFGAVGLGICGVLGACLDDPPWSEFGLTQRGQMANGTTDRYELVSPGWSILYGGGDKSQMGQLRRAMQRCTPEAFVNQPGGAAIDIYRRLCEMQPKLSNAIKAAQVQPDLRGNCASCPRS